MTAEISMSELIKHSNKKSLWIVIHNQVYDVTKFLEEHPGGEEALLDFAGKDGTQAFEEVGHSDDARQLLKKFKIGTLPPGEMSKSVAKDCQGRSGSYPSCLSPSSRTASESKTWRTFDGAPARATKTKSDYKKPTTPRAERRVDAIVVPRESSGNLKWALLALAGAIIIGVALKKYMG